MIEADRPVTPLLVRLIITKRNGSPAVELRRFIMDTDLIKALVSAAFNDRPIIIQPVFKDNLRAVSSLCDVGLLYKEDGEFYFTI